MKRARATVRGDKDIIANIRRAQRSVGGAFLTGAMRDSLQPMKQETEQNAVKLRNYVGKYSSFFPQPKGKRKGGHLDEGVAVAMRENKGMFRKEMWLAFKKRARKLAHLVEYGTAPHNQPNFKGGFDHPGSEPHPFFRPAFESKKNDVVNALSRHVWQKISGSIIGGFKR